MPNISILAQAVLKIAFIIAVIATMAESKMGHILVNIARNLHKS